MDIRSIINVDAPVRVRVSGHSLDISGAGNVFSTISGAEIKINSIDKDGTVAVYVDARLDSGTFANENAIRITYAANGIKESMADYLYSPFWCAPAFPKTVQEIPEKTQGLLSKLDNGEWLFILPVCDSVYKCSIAGSSLGISAVIESYANNISSCDNQLAFVAAKGENPYELVEKVAKRAIELLDNGMMMRTDKKYPEIFEKLGWCTWDAMHVHVNDAGIQRKIKEFKDKGLPVDWVIIDDMWATVPELVGIPEDHKTFWSVFQNGRLDSFEGAPEKFPDGLKACIDKVHAEGMRVGMWYPITGYWKGFLKNGYMMQRHPEAIKKINSKYLVAPEDKGAHEVYSDIAKWFRDCGADFIKIDNQSSYKTNYFNCGVSVGQMARTLQAAVEDAAIEHFGNDGDIALINCMCMAVENMFNRKESSICRCSNDFQPENRPWFATHILQCAFNSLIQGQYYFNDWDMWWSSDGQALKNSVCRAISGGPIYVSDRNDETNPDILWPLILDDGTIIRTEAPAVPTYDCITVDPTKEKKPMKIFSKKNGATVIAAFNIDAEEGAVSGEICPADFGFEGEVAVYEYFTKEGKIVSADAKLSVELANPDVFSLYVIAPLADGKAVIGASEKMIAPGTYNVTENGMVALTNGKFTAVCRAGATVKVGDKVYTAENDGVLIFDVKKSEIIK